MRVALLPGDGVGPEVIAQAQKVVDVLALDLEWEELSWGSAWWHANGEMMPPDAIERLRGFDAILMGAVGDPSVPDTEALWGLILKIRQELDLWANVRPAKLLDGVPCPLAGRDARDIDMVFVRENTEGEYAGIGGRAHRGLPTEVAVESSVFTRAACERVARYAFELAMERERSLANATKSNASRHVFPFWDEVVEDVARDFPEVRVERILVDALAARLITNPGSIDVVVASNLFGDILTDIAAALQGGLGMAASASLAPGSSTTALFEPVHGSAPDIAGKGIANPCGAIWSAALMLEHLGCAAEASQVMSAMEITCASGPRTRDVGGTAGTAEVGEAIARQLRDIVADGTPRAFGVPS